MIPLQIWQQGLRMMRGKQKVYARLLPVTETMVNPIPSIPAEPDIATVSPCSTISRPQPSKPQPSKPQPNKPQSSLAKSLSKSADLPSPEQIFAEALARNKNVTTLNQNNTPSIIPNPDNDANSLAQKTFSKSGTAAAEPNSDEPTLSSDEQSINNYSAKAPNLSESQHIALSELQRLRPATHNTGTSDTPTLLIAARLLAEYWEQGDDLPASRKGLLLSLLGKLGLSADQLPLK